MRGTEGLLAVLDRDEVLGVWRTRSIRAASGNSDRIDRGGASDSLFDAGEPGDLFVDLFGGGFDDDDAPNPLVVIVLTLAAPLAAEVMPMALSRSREFEADRLGAELVGDPRPMASALATLGRAAHAVPMEVTPAQATACNVEPLTGRDAKVSNLFLAHPPTEARIAALLAHDPVLAGR